MAALPFTILSPHKALAPGDHTTQITAIHPVAQGNLHAIWVHETQLPSFQSGPHAVHDPKMTHFDFYLYLEDVAGIVAFTPRWDGGYILMGVWLERHNACAAGRQRGWEPAFQWHQVVSETPVPCGPMRRNDRKTLRRRYDLASGESVQDRDLVPGSAFPKLTLMNGTKFILEVNWEMEIRLADGESAEDSGVDLEYEE